MFPFGILKSFSVSIAVRFAPEIIFYKFKYCQPVTERAMGDTNVFD